MSCGHHFISVQSRRQQRLLTQGGQLPAMAYNSDHKHDGTGAINDSESIVAHIAVRITDVLPNGNLVIEGKRETSFSGEHQTIILRGMVRSDDVASDNTVLSYNVADATIQIIGKGTVTDSTEQRLVQPALGQNQSFLIMPLVPRHLNPKRFAQWRPRRTCYSRQ